MTKWPDKVGVLISCLLLYALAASPFMTFRANRIIQGETRTIFEALPVAAATLLVAIIVVAAFIAFFRFPARLKLAAALVGLAALAIFVGQAASALTPEGNSFARVSPASGFWLMFAGLALLAADCIARLQPKPTLRILLLLVATGTLAAVLTSGLWDDLSIIKEYNGRADIFWTEALRHVELAIGSLVAATLAGIPLGILCYKVERLRSGLLNALNIVQTIPSIALFGLLIAPLGWMAANVPGAAKIGIAGIGMAPAFVALFLYSLLPVVSNTVVGLSGVSQAVREAARGLGMTPLQRLLRVEFPLAMPVILTGIRIVLVQNIGLATIAALIGGGGFGVFVFQGIGQTAMDLVLLGTVPTVLLGFAAAITLDALIDSNLFSAGGRQKA
ncbi:ABC transporter permease [Agrobacterium tumefaciens]|uniref:ABC transporter permease n=1 Tax=Agrobacterium TaxID=357 RepID=UPI000EF343BD|nr:MULTISPECIES: ABC transporter permease [Agrobacterium]AYM12171.1 osmoprotectant transport system permease protein [Agrobacterium tumefaciens]NSY41786.1 ABC transporter permease [Agrobacterium tumefaciens]NSY88934.1 ABC transporter permease [Agrobacterium tumefaciens]NSZ82672.1 ABC transporter permease [Agrobacterium tumefaciens]WCA68921.1 ABC transporter permease [Agrobacterium tumefaciens]